MGLETDRFFAEWWIKSKRVENRISEQIGRRKLTEYLTERAKIANITKSMKED